MGCKAFKELKSIISNLLDLQDSFISLIPALLLFVIILKLYFLQALLFIKFIKCEVVPPYNKFSIIIDIVFFFHKNFENKNLTLKNLILFLDFSSHKVGQDRWVNYLTLLRLMGFFQKSFQLPLDLRFHLLTQNYLDEYV